jgi:phenylacetate-coenzyme A ligase PaaK-like adenylate-forming protein
MWRVSKAVGILGDPDYMRAATQYCLDRGIDPKEVCPRELSDGGNVTRAELIAETMREHWEISRAVIAYGLADMVTGELKGVGEASARCAQAEGWEDVD